MPGIESQHNQSSMVHKTKKKTLLELGLDSGTSEKSICIPGI